MTNRCPVDASVLRFDHIKVYLLKGRRRMWTRWDKCDQCNLLVVRGDAGVVVGVLAKEPKR